MPVRYKTNLKQTLKHSFFKRKNRCGSAAANSVVPASFRRSRFQLCAPGSVRLYPEGSLPLQARFASNSTLAFFPQRAVRLIRLPPKVRGVTVPNDDGTFSVYINALYDVDSQRRTLEHELEHLARDHFYSVAPVAVQEAEASGRAAAPPVPRPPRHYASLRELERYLRSVGALDKTLEELGIPM